MENPLQGKKPLISKRLKLAGINQAK